MSLYGPPFVEPPSWYSSCIYPPVSDRCAPWPARAIGAAVSLARHQAAAVRKVERKNPNPRFLQKECDEHGQAEH